MTSDKRKARPQPALDFDMLDKIVGYRLRRAQTFVYEDYAATMKGMGVRPAQFAALTLIAANPGMTQTTLANAMGIERSGAVMLIDALEKEGLAERGASPTDRRSHALELTAQGRALLPKLKKKVEEHDDRVTRRLSPKERATLGKLLQRIYQI